MGENDGKEKKIEHHCINQGAVTKALTDCENARKDISEVRSNINQQFTYVREDIKGLSKDFSDAVDGLREIINGNGKPGLKGTLNQHTVEIKQIGGFAKAVVSISLALVLAMAGVIYAIGREVSKISTTVDYIKSSNTFEEGGNTDSSVANKPQRPQRAGRKK